MGHLSVAFTVPRLGKLLLRELRLARHEIDPADQEPREISPESYERLAIREVERYGADVPEPAIFVSPGRRKRRRRLQRAKVSQTVRCVYLARALKEVCALERVRAACQAAVEVAAVCRDLNDYYKRRRVRLTAGQNRLDALGSTPFRDKAANQSLVDLKAFFAALLQSAPLPVESVVTLPIKEPAQFSQESWAKISHLLREAGLTQAEAASLLYDDFDSKTKSAKNRFGQKAFRARKRRAR